MTTYRNHGEEVAALLAASGGRCAWFALCPNAATGLSPHPILGNVATCDRCAAFAADDHSASRRVEVLEREAPHLLGDPLEAVANDV